MDTLGRFKINNIYCEDCYTAIRNIPDHTIDLIYTDIPYLYSQGGGGKSELGKRTAKKRLQLMGVNDDKIKQLLEKEETRSKALSLGKKLNNRNDMENGIDYTILDEFCRVLKHIYIYILFQTSNIASYEIFYRRKKMYV